MAKNPEVAATWPLTATTMVACGGTAPLSCPTTRVGTAGALGSMWVNRSQSRTLAVTFGPPIDPSLAGGW
jgi:hypothetical protein